MRWVQVIPGVTLKSYTFFKPLDLSRSNGKKNTFINTNVFTNANKIVQEFGPYPKPNIAI